MTNQQPHFDSDMQYTAFGNGSRTGPWLKFRVDKEILDLFDGREGEVFRVIGFSQEQVEVIAKSVEQKQKDTGEYGQFAVLLDKAKLWQHQRIVKLSGTDADYQAWCRRQPCAISGGKGEQLESGEWRCQYAHMNFADNSGMGVKATYSGLPMTNEAHLHIQHEKGIEALKTAFLKSKKRHKRYKDMPAKDLLQLLVRKYTGKWAREAFRQKHFEVDSWTKVVPQQFMTKMRELGIDDLVPLDYRDALNYRTYHEG